VSTRNKPVHRASVAPVVADPEIFFAIVAPMGSNTDAAVDALHEALDDWNYQLTRIKVSNLVKKKRIFGHYDDGLSTYEHYKCGIEACNAARAKLGSNDAMVRLALIEVENQRLLLHGEGGEPSEDLNDRIIPVRRRAYVFQSLKLPEEIQTLRRVYGDLFFSISIHSPREMRLRSLAERIKESVGDPKFKRHFAQAEELLSQDEHEGGYGQNIRDAFPLADFFTASDKPEDLKRTIGRFISTIFRHPFVTPSRDELAMAHARSVAMRSADLSRQIGATITNEDGDVVAMGCNDVPRAGGGQYFEGDKDDARDYLLSYDPNDKFKKYVISEFLGRMAAAKWLKAPLNRLTPERLYEIASASDGPEAFLDDSRVDNLIEFGRIMHAEMAALMDAARRGLSLRGTTLYCTTFPCHMCTRLLIGAGIMRVVYIEPYPKSMALQLYEQQISIDPEASVIGRVTFEPFTGVSPRRYFELFSMTKNMRKDKATGKALPINRRGQPRLEIASTSYVDIETLIALEASKAINTLEKPPATRRRKKNNARLDRSRKKTRTRR